MRRSMIRVYFRLALSHQSDVTPQLFAPHLTSTDSNFINIGIYGLPSCYAPIKKITRKLEQKTSEYGGESLI